MRSVEQFSNVGDKYLSSNIRRFTLTVDKINQIANLPKKLIFLLIIWSVYALLDFMSLYWFVLLELNSCIEKNNIELSGWPIANIFKFLNKKSVEYSITYKL